MFKIMKFSNMIFMALATAGFVSWFLLNHEIDAYFGQKILVAMGFGVCYSCAMVYWITDISKLNKWERQVEMFKEKLNGIAFRCPDCGMVSHNPNDAINSYCGFCRAYKA